MSAEYYFASVNEAARTFIRQHKSIPNLTQGALEKLFYAAAEQGGIVVQRLNGKNVVSRTDINKWLQQNGVSFRILDEASLSIRDIHKALGAQLRNEEIVEFISRQIYMGMPRPLAAKGRGRKPRRTQYDVAYGHRKGFYHRLVRLPASGASARLEIGDKLRDCVIEIARELLPHTRRHKLVSGVIKKLEGRKLQDSDPSHIRYILTVAGIRTPKPN